MGTTAQPAGWQQNPFAALGAAVVRDQNGPPTDNVAGVAEQLMREFGLIVSLDTVTACVLAAQRDLDHVALHQVPPNLLDRLARARLLEALNLRDDPPRREPPRAARPAS